LGSRAFEMAVVSVAIIAGADDTVVLMIATTRTLAATAKRLMSSLVTAWAASCEAIQVRYAS